MYTTYDNILRYILNLGFKDFILFLEVKFMIQHWKKRGSWVIAAANLLHILTYSLIAAHTHLYAEVDKDENTQSEVGVVMTNRSAQSSQLSDVEPSTAKQAETWTSAKGLGTVLIVVPNPHPFSE